MGGGTEHSSRHEYQNSLMGEIKVKLQPGFQTRVATSPADILIMGGAAGCGKTRSLLMEPVRHIRVPGFTGICFRREYRQIDGPGALWQKSMELYSMLPPHLRPRAVGGDFKYFFPKGPVHAFDHLNNDAATSKYDGPEFTLIEFDELIHFTEYQFRYMLSRNRSTCGVRPYIRCGTNPQGFGWVKDLVKPWIYPDDYHVERLQGAPIPEMSGQLRFVAVYEDRWIIEETPEKVLAKLPQAIRKNASTIKSLAFIGGTLQDNPALLSVDPGYEGALLALPEKDRIRLADGRWIDPTAGQKRLFLDTPIQDMFTNSFVRGTGRRYITADIAFSGDRFVIMVWDGWVVIDVEVYEKTDPEDVVNKIRSTAQRWGVPGRRVAFDSGGLGGYLRGFLRTAFPFYGSARPIDEEQEVKTKQQRLGLGKPIFENLRAQCFYLLKDKVDECGIFFAVNAIHLQRELHAELATVKRAGEDDDGKLQIIPKEEQKQQLKRSPDLADCLSMRVVFDLIPDKDPYQRQIETM